MNTKSELLNIFHFEDFSFLNDSSFCAYQILDLTDKEKIELRIVSRYKGKVCSIDVFTKENIIGIEITLFNLVYMDNDFINYIEPKITQIKKVIKAKLSNCNYWRVKALFFDFKVIIV